MTSNKRKGFSLIELLIVVRNALLGVGVAVMGLGLLAYPVDAQGRTFYVDSTAGNDSNAGTILRPLGEMLRE